MRATVIPVSAPKESTGIDYAVFDAMDKNGGWTATDTLSIKLSARGKFMDVQHTHNHLKNLKRMGLVEVKYPADKRNVSCILWRKATA